MLSMTCSAGPWSPSDCQGGPGEREGSWSEGWSVAQVKHMISGVELRSQLFWYSR